MIFLLSTCCLKSVRSHRDTSLLSEGQLFGDTGLWAGKVLYRAAPAVRKDLGFEVSFEGLSLFTNLFETQTQILIMRYMTQRFIKVLVAQVFAYRSLCKFAERKHPLNFIFISQNGLQWIQVYLFSIFLSVRFFSRFLFKSWPACNAVYTSLLFHSCH